MHDEDFGIKAEWHFLLQVIEKIPATVLVAPLSALLLELAFRLP